MPGLQRPLQYRRVLPASRCISTALSQLLANAKVAGMSTDLDLIGLRYNIAAAVFFVRIYVDAEPGITNTCQASVLCWSNPIVRRYSTYLIRESNNIHRNIILKLFRPSIWSTVVFLMQMRVLIKNTRYSTHNHGRLGLGHDLDVSREDISWTYCVRFSNTANYSLSCWPWLYTVPEFSSALQKLGCSPA